MTGRPRLLHPRDVVYQWRLTEAERERYEAAARGEDLKLSEWLRRAAEQRIDAQKPWPTGADQG